MKIKLLGSLILILIWTVCGMAFTWGEVYMSKAPELEVADEYILYPSGIDDPQPDTLQYDSGTGSYLLYGGLNLWANQRFTAPVEFELRSIYILPFNGGNNTTNACTVKVYTDLNGNPGSQLASVIRPAPIPPNGQWIDVNVPSPIVFNEGEDFHIMFSCPSGPWPGTGWFMYFDGDPICYNRTTYSNSPSGPWTSVPYDLMLRAGGELTGTFLDLTTMSVFNLQDRFFLEAGEPVIFKARVGNIGMLNADIYVYKWEVKDELGNTVWLFEDAYTNLLAGAEVVLTADSAWTTSQNGTYFCYGTVTHPDDADHSNDENSLEQGFNSLDVWYLYDDGSGEVNFSFNPGDGIGNSFIPTSFPVSVDTIAIGISTGGNCNVSIYQNDGFGGVPNTQLWTTNANLDTGWNYLTPGVDVFDDGFTVAVEPQANITLRMDDSVPCAGSNMDMSPIAWNSTGGWSNWGSGDLLIRAYVTESSTAPPYPVMELSADTIYFADTPVGNSVSYFLTVYNVGGQDDLIISNIAMNPTVPPNIFTLLNFTPPLTIPAGDSSILEFEFEPPEVGSFSTVAGIFNNGEPFLVLVPMYGDGVSASAVTVTLTPSNPPIQIPGSGGTFEFNIGVANNDYLSWTFDIWTMATLPNGHEYGPIIGPIELTVAPGASINRDRTQAIPAGAPTGDYTYDAYIGDYPNDIIDEDHFDFEKLAQSDGGPIVPDWNNWGESFSDAQATGLSAAPTEFALYPAYPNPFNPETNLRFSIPEPGNVSLILYDVQGKEVVRLVDGWYSAGIYEATFDASSLSSGIYFARLTAKSFQGTRKMLLIK